MVDRESGRSKLPIGYWLREADRLLTERINRLHAAHGVSRHDWQVLNFLGDAGSSTKEGILETMRTFVDSRQLSEIVANLVDRAWVGCRTRADRIEEFFLTADGRRKHRELLASQKEFRTQAMKGVSDEDYTAVVRALQRIVENLSSTESTLD